MKSQTHNRGKSHQIWTKLNWKCTYWKLEMTRYLKHLKFSTTSPLSSETHVIETKTNVVATDQAVRITSFTSETFSHILETISMENNRSSFQESSYDSILHIWISCIDKLILFSFLYFILFSVYQFMWVCWKYANCIHEIGLFN